MTNMPNAWQYPFGTTQLNGLYLNRVDIGIVHSIGLSILEIAKIQFCALEMHAPAYVI